MALCTGCIVITYHPIEKADSEYSSPSLLVLCLTEQQLQDAGLNKAEIIKAKTEVNLVDSGFSTDDPDEANQWLLNHGVDYLRNFLPPPIIPRNQDDLDRCLEAKEKVEEFESSDISSSRSRVSSSVITKNEIKSKLSLVSNPNAH